MNHLQKLKKLQNKPHLYLGKELVIKDYQLDEENLDLSVTVDGARSEMNMPISDAGDFFDKLLPMENQKGVTQSRADVQVFNSQQNSLATMRKQLMELNEKLSGPDGEKYIKQAKALNNNINTLINSLKLEFQIAKEVRRNNL